MRFVVVAISIVGVVTACTPPAAVRLDEPDAGGSFDAATDLSPTDLPVPGSLDSPPASSGLSDASLPFGGGSWPLLVAVGNDGRRLVSPDGLSWGGDVRDGTGNNDNGPRALRAVAFAQGTVVAVGGGCAPDCVGRLVTFDGKSWADVPLPPGLGRLNGVAFGAGIWVAVGTQGPVLRSLDGARTWVPTGAPAPPGLRGVAFGQVGGREMFVAVGDGYTRARSVDGLTWTDVVPSSGTSDGFRLAVMGNDVVVAVGGRSGNGRRARSADGVTWTDDVSGGPDLLSLIFTDDSFMAFSATGENAMYSSPDGIVWTTQTTVNAGVNVATGLLGGQRLFISRLSPATIRTSTDGLTWVTRLMSMPRDATINAFVFAQ
jgi:hypothetical protein